MEHRSRMVEIQDTLLNERDPVVREKLKKQLEELILLSRDIHRQEHELEQKRIEFAVKETI